MKNFINAEIEVIEMVATDIIATSDPTGETGNNGGGSF